MYATLVRKFKSQGYFKMFEEIHSRYVYRDFFLLQICYVNYINQNTMELNHLINLYE